MITLGTGTTGTTNKTIPPVNPGNPASPQTPGAGLTTKPIQDTQNVQNTTRLENYLSSNPPNPEQSNPEQSSPWHLLCHYILQNPFEKLMLSALFFLMVSHKGPPAKAAAVVGGIIAGDLVGMLEKKVEDYFKGPDENSWQSELKKGVLQTLVLSLLVVLKAFLIQKDPWSAHPEEHAVYFIRGLSDQSKKYKKYIPKKGQKIVDRALENKDWHQISQIASQENKTPKQRLNKIHQVASQSTINKMKKNPWSILFRIPFGILSPVELAALKTLLFTGNPFKIWLIYGSVIGWTRFVLGTLYKKALETLIHKLGYRLPEEKQAAVAIA